MNTTFTTILVLILSFLSISYLQGQDLTEQTYTKNGRYSFTVPNGGDYKVIITAKGGDGGSVSSNEPERRGGTGATMVGSFSLRSGDVLDIIVGAAGRCGSPNVLSAAGGGGGGTGVILNGTKLLVVAGGGGGASALSGGDGGKISIQSGKVGQGGKGGGGGSLEGAGGERSIHEFGGGGGQLELNKISLGGVGVGTSGGGGGAGLGGGGGAGGGIIGNSGGGGGGYTGGNGAVAAVAGAQGGSSYIDENGVFDWRNSMDGIKSGADNMVSDGMVSITLEEMGGEVLGFASMPTNVTNNDTKQFYGLFIGIDNYEGTNWETLEHSVKDAKAIQTVLENKYGIDKVVALHGKAATRERIIGYIDNFAESANANDQLLIYYSGHGKEMNGESYWVPASAISDSRADLVSTTEIKNIMTKSKARNILLLSDASMKHQSFKSAISNGSDGTVSRIIISSGTESSTKAETEENSIFAKYLTKFLTNNKAASINARTLFNKLRLAVESNSPYAPQLSQLEVEGMEAGKFIFILED